MIAVRINGTLVDVDDGTDLAEVVRANTDEQRGVAVAVNAEVVPRSAWTATMVAAGDRIEILRAVPGG